MPASGWQPQCRPAIYRVLETPQGLLFQSSIVLQHILGAVRALAPFGRNWKQSQLHPDAFKGVTTSDTAVNLDKPKPDHVPNLAF